MRNTSERPDGSCSCGFCWLFCLIVIAAFADMVADTFNAYVVTDGVPTLSDSATGKRRGGKHFPVLHPVCR